MDQRRVPIRAWSLFILAVGVASLILFSRFRGASELQRESSSKREKPPAISEPEDLINNVMPGNPKNAGAADTDSDLPPPRRHPRIESRAQAEALVLAAMRAKDIQLLHELADDPDLERYLGLLEFNRIVIEEGKRHHEEVLRTGGRKRPSEPIDELLSSFLRDPSPELITKLRSSVFSSDDVAKLEDLYKALDDRSKRVLLKIAQDAQGEALSGFLLQIAQNGPSMDDRIRALQALQRRKPADAQLDPLEALYQTADDPKLRSAIVGTIGTNASGRASQFVADKLSDPDPEVRAAAVTYGRRTDDFREKLLSLAEFDSIPLVREAALNRLNRILDPADAANTYLKAATTDQSAEVRLCAVTQLEFSRLGDIEDIDKVIGSLNTLRVQERESNVKDEIARVIESLRQLRSIRKKPDQ